MQILLVQLELTIYIVPFLVDLQIFQPKNPPIHMQNTVDILPSHRSCQQELTICIARFLVDLQIFSRAEPKNPTIHWQFLVDLQIFQPKNPPIHMQNTVDILPSHRSCQQELTICIARFLVDLQIFSIASKTKKSSYPLAIPCRFVDFSNMFKNPPIHLQNTVAFLTSNRSSWQELTICIA